MLEGFDESSWDRPDLPSAADLDAITGVPVVLFRTDGHLAIVSSSVLNGLEPADLGGVERDGAGEPTGRLRAGAVQRLSAWLESADDRHQVEEFQLEARRSRHRAVSRRCTRCR